MGRMTAALLLALAAAAVSGCGPRTEELDKLEVRFAGPDAEASYGAPTPVDGLYVPGESTPFTGVVQSRHGNGQLKLEGPIRAGKKEGVHKEWYPNGQLMSECCYKDGARVGLFRGFYEDGRPSVETNYVDGKEDGVCKVWDAQGKLHEMRYKAGKRVK